MDINTQQRPQQTPQRSGGGDFFNNVSTSAKNLAFGLFGILGVITIICGLVYFFGGTAAGKSLMFTNLKYLLISLNLFGVIAMLFFSISAMLNDTAMQTAKMVTVGVSLTLYFVFANTMFAAVAWAIPYMKFIINSTL